MDAPCPALAACAATLLCAAAGCAPAGPGAMDGPRAAPDAAMRHVAGADIERGRALMAQYQCGRCHLAADVPGADGTAAPPLDDFGRRSYVAGALPNLPGPLQRYLLDPAAAVPGTTMPDLGLQPADARDIAGYLLHAR